MKKLKILIIVVIVLIIIVSITIINLPKNKEDRNLAKEAEYYKNHTLQTTIQENTESGKLLNNASMFYTIEDCVRSYITYISLDINKENPIISDDGTKIYSSYNYALSSGVTSDQKKKEVIYKLLDSEYINNNSITVNNIEKYVDIVNIPLSFTANKIRVLQGKNVDVYSVQGEIKRLSNSEFVANVSYKVTIDTYNMTFMIEPLEENTDIDKYELKNNVESIESNDKNKFTYSTINETVLLQKYLSLYKNNALKDPDKAYGYLDSEYKEKKFGNLEGFKEYISKNENIINNITLDKYQKTTKDGYTQYVCIDTNGNYYIFRETATMQYTLLLDTYTIDIPEFTEKYEKADEMTKVGMNIEKIKSALNAKDYNYVYNKFNSGFKNNYFKTVEEFENYVKSNWFNNINITYNKVSEEGNTYIFQVYLSDATGKSSNVITKNFNMQLKSGTDFIFSFEV